MSMIPEDMSIGERSYLWILHRIFKLYMKKIIWTILLGITFFGASAQKFDQLAKTPPMGWNSWNKFACNVSEKLIMQMADEMVSSGMQDAGYEYVVIDDCWQVDRDENGEIVVDKDRFPHGMKYVADYVHSKGLKFGIYSCAGSKTCAGRPGGRGHEFQDARTYASYGVDYLKYDWCNTTTQEAKSSYTTMRDGLFAAKRPVVFSLCEWGTAKPWEWAKEVGHLWRTTGDIVDRWDAMIDILDKEKDLAKYAGPGYWNDPDMLEVGNGGMTTEEYRTHFSLWCMLAAPLMAGNDLGNMSSETAEILKNTEVIALDQDVLGKQGFCYRDNGDYEIWIKKLDNNEKAVCLLNRGDEEKTVQVDYNVLLKANDDYWSSEPYKLENYKLRDLWEHKDVSLEKSTVFVKMPPHSVKVYRFLKK
jgi:alpha-galactosidase